MEDAFARAARVSLQGDGLVSQLFEILWRRDLLSDTSLALQIPDTIIFKFNAPSLWYFTSVDGTIKRKTKANTTCEHIEQEFLKKPSPSGIVAYYVATHEKSPTQARGDADVAGDSDESKLSSTECNTSETIIEYFDAAGLHNFLHDGRHGRDNGILQRFFDPIGESNNMIRAFWSPKVCLLERRVNRLPLNDTRYDMYERAVTFEGPDFHSIVKPVRGASMMTRVQEFADSIVEHVAAVTNERVNVSRMVLNFKVDSRDRLHLLFASSIRLRDELSRGALLGQTAKERFSKKGYLNTPLEITTDLNIPGYISRTDSSVSVRRPAALRKNQECTLCEEPALTGRLYDVPYKIVIEHEEQRAGNVRELPSPYGPPRPPHHCEEQNPVCIPEVLRRLHPRLCAEEYARLRHDIVFLYKTIPVCATCYLRFSGAQLGADGFSVPRRVLDNDIDQNLGGVQIRELPFGTQALNPEPLRDRLQATMRKIGVRQLVDNLGEDEYWRQKNKEMETINLNRAKSCPKLSTLEGKAAYWSVLSKPVLAEFRAARSGLQPLEPSFVQPLSTGFQPCSAKSPAPVRAKRQLLRGQPYLREIAAFTSCCPSRASEVLPKAQVVAPTLRQGQINDTYCGGKSAADADGKDASTSPERTALGRSLEMVSEEIQDDDDDLGESDAEETTKWLPGYGGTRGTTPQTRTPSQGGSRPSTRPSTRTSSAVPQDRLRRPESAVPRKERPKSSPLLHQTVAASDQGSSSQTREVSSGIHRSSSDARVINKQRPHSSPQLRNSSKSSRPRSGALRGSECLR